LSFASCWTRADACRRADRAPAACATTHACRALPMVRAGSGAMSGVSTDDTVLRPASAPFSATGGLKLLQGNLGRSVIKVSAVPDDRHVIEAPGRVFDSQDACMLALQGRRTGPRRGVCGALAGARRPTACPSCTSSRRRWPCCRAGLQGGAGDRWPHERRVGQGACRHPCVARSRGRWPAGPRARR
jgi:hypothetical protein